MRKSKIYLVGSVLCIFILIWICFIFKLPSKFGYNLLRFILISLGFILYCWYVSEKDFENSSNSHKRIENLQSEYSYIDMIVLVHTRLFYDDLSKKFSEAFYTTIDNNNYLLDFENNIEAFKAKNSKNKIENEFITVACVMDSLISSWKIKTFIPKRLVLDEDLVLLNCKLAVSVALSLCNLSYDDLKDNAYIQRLIELLSTCYLEKNYGNTSTIEYEAMILELLYNDFQKSE